MTFSVNYPESFYLIMSNAGDQGNFQILYRRDPWITDVTRFDATPSGSNFTLTGFYKGTEVQGLDGRPKDPESLIIELTLSDLADSNETIQVAATVKFFIQIEDPEKPGSRDVFTCRYQ